MIAEYLCIGKERTGQDRTRSWLNNEERYASTQWRTALEFRTAEVENWRGIGNAADNHKECRAVELVSQKVKHFGEVGEDE